MNRRTVSAAIIAFVAVVASLHATGPQKKPDRKNIDKSSPLFTKGATLTLIVPPNAFSHEAYALGGGGHVVYGVKVGANPAGEFTAGPLEHWKTSHFPGSIELTFEKIDFLSRETFVEYRSTGNGPYVKFHIAPTLMPGDVLGQMFIVGARESAAVKSYTQAFYDLVAKGLFIEELTAVPADKRNALLQLAHLTAKGINIKRETYKEKTYFAVDVDHTTVYNDNLVSEPQRAARVIGEQLLTLAKMFAAPLRDIPGLYGIKLHSDMPFSRGAPTYGADGYDKLDLYAPADLIRQFASDEITSQKFIDGCVVIVDGNRVQIDLAAR